MEGGGGGREGNKKINLVLGRKEENWKQQVCFELKLKANALQLRPSYCNFAIYVFANFLIEFFAVIKYDQHFFMRQRMLRQNIFLISGKYRELCILYNNYKVRSQKKTRFCGKYQNSQINLDEDLTRQGVSAYTECDHCFTSFCDIFVG